MEDQIKIFDQISTIFDSLNMGIYVADMNTYEILFLNKHAMDVYGADNLGKPCFQVIHAGREPCAFCTNDRLLRDGVPEPPYVWEFHNTRNGKWYQLIDRAIPWTDGRLVRMEIAVDITEHKLTEKTIKCKLAFEETVKRISSRFVGVYNIDYAINASLADMGRLSRASSAYMVLFRQDGTTMDNTHEWCAVGVKRRMKYLQNLPINMFPWWMAKLSKGDFIYIADVSSLPAAANSEKKLLKSQGVESVLVLPLYIKGDLSGYIGFNNVGEIVARNDEDLALLRVSAEIISSALERHRVEEALRESEEKYRAIFETTGTAMIIVEDDMTISLANREFEKLFGYSKTVVEHKKKWTDFFVKSDLERMKEYHNRRRIDPHGTPNGYECRAVDRQGNVIDIFLTASMIPGTRKSVASLLNITGRKRAEQEISQSYERLRRVMNDIIQTMASTIEIRDPYTAGHQVRVTKLACDIARKMGLQEEQIEGIKTAALVHDIGKIYVPAEFLSKPGRLKENEFSIIKDHPQVGYDILKTIEFPWPIADIVLQHHERLNGSGYPAGLSGGDILLEARILAVADVIEAMSSHRPYRPALGMDQALAEISRNSGILYDPDIVNVCIDMFSNDS